MKINKTWLGYEVTKRLDNGIIETIFINTFGVNRVRVSLALLFAVLGNYDMVENILERW